MSPNQRVYITDALNNPAAVDPLTSQLIVIDSVHFRIHAGKMFQADHVAEGVADAGVIEVLVNVPTDIIAHMAFQASSGGNARLEIFENPTVTGAGTALSELNRNRRSGTTADVVATHTPTTSADGTALSDILVPGGTGGNSAGGVSESFAEWVLKSNEDYLIRLTNIAGTAQPLGLEIDWYEPV